MGWAWGVMHQALRDNGPDEYVVSTPSDTNWVRSRAVMGVPLLASIITIFCMLPGLAQAETRDDYSVLSPDLLNKGQQELLTGVKSFKLGNQNLAKVAVSRLTLSRY